ncbi:MAG: hypothetical protein M2R45_05453 [Verrucomicrobia subdivision 3 bacterium]|nr:hypothetical protein [Limisphaerales bacterium]
MRTTVEQVNAWRKARSEDENLEFKEAKTQFDTKRLCDYCVGIANEGGGYLLLGIADRPPRTIVGTNAFKNPVRMESKLFDMLRFRVEIDEVDHPDGRVLVFKIPSRSPGSAYEFQGKYLMRIGSQLKPMSQDQLRRIFEETKPNYLEELAKDNLSAQDVLRLLDTKIFFELLNTHYPTRYKEVLKKLEDDRLIRTQKNRFAILNIGAVLLANNMRDFDIYRKAPRLVVHDGVSKVRVKYEQTRYKGYAIIFQDLVEHIMSQIPQNEVIEDALREEIKLVPETIIRELVANALIHQDFSASGTSPMIEIYDDRVEISNPGNPIVPMERFIDGYESRNERLADIMRRMGMCEERGSGIDRVIMAAEASQLPAPDFRVQYGRTSVVIFGPRSFSNMDKSNRIRACYQHCALQLVMGKRMTNQSLRKRFGLSASSTNTVSQIISATIGQKLVKLDPAAPRSRKYACYLPIWA